MKRKRCDTCHYGQWFKNKQLAAIAEVMCKTCAGFSEWIPKILEEVVNDEK